MLARYNCHRESVCPSVCLSQARVPQRWQNLSSRKQGHTVAQELWFTHSKILGEIPTKSPQWRRRIEIGRLKAATFDQYFTISPGLHPRTIDYTWPNRLLCFLIIRFMSGGRPGRSMLQWTLFGPKLKLLNSFSSPWPL